MIILLKISLAKSDLIKYTFVCQILLSGISAKPSLGVGCQFLIVKGHLNLDCLKSALGVKLFSETVKNFGTASLKL